MSIERTLPKVLPWCLQKCPLCKENKYVVARGVVKLGDSVARFPDRGYSFCNCRNIWFTEWENIDQRSWRDNESVEVLRYYLSDNNLEQPEEVKAEFYLRDNPIQNRGYGKNKFMITGKAPKTLAEAERLGFDTRITFENYDLIWSYHTLQRERDPLFILQTYYNSLEKEGTLFISMPDPYFIEFNDTAAWGHWLLRENHIMWDMDSFCDEAEMIGFKTIMKKRNMDVMVCKDMHLVFKK